ncbi:uncharacterized protein LOC143913657 [Arctopsyche grandis]|uniref:uncharacterized protein LOC143913657 n=1 Tax=Arctopsyche grandis TaxID=121162 RepID=UPI00406D818B
MKNHELSKKIVMFLICITALFFVGSVKAVDEINVSCPYLYKKVVIENTTLCLKLKKEESYMNKYTGCNGNAVPINFSYLVSSNNIKTSTTLYWTDYRRAYDDGPIIKWRHGDPDMGQPLLLDLVDGYSGYQNKINTSASACLAIDIKSQKFVTRDCDDKLYRLCIVKPIKPHWSWEPDVCKINFIYFDSPRPTCLSKTIDSSENTIFQSGTRKEAEDACKFGKLMGKGFIYNPISRFRNMNIPLAIHSENNIFMYHNGEIADEEITDIYPSLTKKFLSVNESGKLNLRDQNFIYDAVVCEYPVEKPRMSLKIYSNFVTTWKLFVSIECEESILVSPSDIICFTDSARFYPTRVNVTNLNELSHFSIETGADGYYWCISNTTKWEYNISRKFFFVNKIQDLKEIYDVEFNFPKPINISDVENHYFLQLQNLFKSYEREIDLSKYILKKVYINGGVIYRCNISYFDINDHGSIYVHMQWRTGTEISACQESKGAPPGLKKFVPPPHITKFSSFHHAKNQGEKINEIFKNGNKQIQVQEKWQKQNRSTNFILQIFRFNPCPG